MHSVRPSPAPSAASAAPDPSAAHDAARRCGITLHDDPYGVQTRVEGDGLPAGAAALAEGAIAWLAGRSVLRLSGDDASRFLHSQTTNDVLGQPAGVARWHGYCSPKGRLLATMLVWRDGQTIRLLLPDSVAEPIRRRLTMFVLRSKVRIANESDAFVVFGLSGAAAPAALARVGLRAPGAFETVVEDEVARDGAVPDDAAVPRHSSLTAIGLSALPARALGGAKDAPDGAENDAPGGVANDGVARWLLVVPLESAQATWGRLRETLRPVDSDAWRWTEVRSGIASIVPATSEQFVPQMLNLEAEAIGAVSFTKGCYPGQEVVARSHYLGKAKRRAFLARIVAGAEGAVAREPAPGRDVVDGSGREIGLVVSAAPSPDGAVDVLFEAQVAAVQAGAIAVDGQALQPLELPYPLPAA